MTDKPMVSVVTITYNNAHQIERAIKGVVSQKAPFKIELIISDDASTDSTPQVVEKWRRRYPDVIRYYRNPRNLGLQRNYLEAFKHCTGRYLAMCDADDYWCNTHKLARQVAYMEQHPECAISFHRVINWYEGTGVKSFSNGGQAVDTTISDLARGNFITNMSVLYRRELVDLHNLPGWLGEIALLDYGMHMLYASRGAIHYFKTPMGVYRQSQSGTWSLASEYKRLDMAYQVRLRLWRHFEGDDRVIPSLREATLNVLAAMYRVAGHDETLRREVLEKLAAIDPEMSEGALSMRSNNQSRNKPSLKRKILRAVRVQVSKLMPLP